MNAEEQKQYDAEYQAEMDRLNGEALPDKDKITEPESKTPEPEAEIAEDPPAEDPFAAINARLESTEKALKDTKSWASKNAAEVKRLKSELEARQRAENRPQVLDDNPGLEDAIRHVTGERPAANSNPVEDWANAVAKALPEMDALLTENPELQAKAAARARELGEDWNDPFIAIRELGQLQREHERTTASATARAAAQKDFQQKSKKQTAMQMPGGSPGAARPPARVDEVARIEGMSPDDFNKMRAKVLGYS